jgi:hypothetical protein
MDQHVCLVMTMEDDGRLPAPGKHRAHPAHYWWYTSTGGGHQLDYDPKDDQFLRNVKRWYCPGR